MKILKLKNKKKITEAFIRVEKESIFKKFPNLLASIPKNIDAHSKIQCIFTKTTKSEREIYNGSTSSFEFVAYANMYEINKELDELIKKYNNSKQQSSALKKPTIFNTQAYKDAYFTYLNNKSTHTILIPHKEQYNRMRDKWGFIGKKIMDVYGNNRAFATYDPRYDLVYSNSWQRDAILKQIKEWEKQNPTDSFNIIDEETLPAPEIEDASVEKRTSKPRQISSKIDKHGFFYVQKRNTTPVYMNYINEDDIDNWISKYAKWINGVSMTDAIIVTDSKLNPIEIHNATVTNGDINNIIIYNSVIKGGVLSNITYFIDSILDGGDFINGDIADNSIVKSGNVINSNLYGTMKGGVFNGGIVKDTSNVMGGVFISGRLDNSNDIKKFTGEIPNFVVVDTNLYYNNFIIINDKKTLFKVLDTMKPREQSLINSDDGFILLDFEKKFLDKELPQFLFIDYEDNLDSGKITTKNKMKLKYGFLIPPSVLKELERDFDNTYMSKYKLVFDKYVVLPYSFAYDYFDNK